MKTCPECKRTYEEEDLSFCLEDGTRLVGASQSSADAATTVKIPGARLTSDAPTEFLPREQSETTQTSPARVPQAPPVHRPEPVADAPTRSKSNAGVLILVAAVILGLSAIAVALIMTRKGGDENKTETAQAAQNENVALETPSPGEPSAEAVSNEAAKPAASPVSTATPSIPGAAKGGQDYIPPGGASPSDSTAVAGRLPPVAAPPREVPDEPLPPAPKPTPTPQARPSGPISGGVLNGKAISKPVPPYPAVARAARASGTVTVQVTVDESGKVISARAVSGHPLLQASAVQAAYQARFSPTLLSGQPVKVTGVITYNFVLQ